LIDPLRASVNYRDGKRNKEAREAGISIYLSIYIYVERERERSGYI
jgi:hypothetical protein